MSDLSQPSGESRTSSVLIVDDEPLIRWSLRQAFVERGHEVVTAADGAEALAAVGARPRPFGIVILDYRLPDRQDLSLLDDIVRLSPTSVVLMMTAFADEAIRSQALAHGAIAVVDKPFQVKSVVSRVEAAVAS